jgi:hypothetical protein
MVDHGRPIFIRPIDKLGAMRGGAVSRIERCVLVVPNSVENRVRTF